MTMTSQLASEGISLGQFAEVLEVEMHMPSLLGGMFLRAKLPKLEGPT